MNKQIDEEMTPQEYEKFLTQRAIKGIYHAVITLEECYRLFWGRQPEMIIASLNENVSKTLARFTSNTEIGTALNYQMAKTKHTVRVPVTMPEGYGFDSESLTFTYNIPVVATPEPEIIAEEPQVIGEVVNPEPPLPDMAEPNL
jgi:hypothetical protein